MDRILYRTKKEKILLVLLACTAFRLFLSEMNQSPKISKFYHGTVHHKTAIPLPDFFQNWRNNFLASNAPPLGFDDLGLVRGIFLGDSTSIPKSVQNTFRLCGLSHLLAASGFNCWIVAAAFSFWGRFLVYCLKSKVPSYLYLLLRRHWGPTSSFIGAWLFWSWTDQSSPITRSALLISLRFALHLIGFDASFGRILLVQYASSLVVVPKLWHDTSFQLTFGCLFGMVLVPRFFEIFRPKNSTLWFDLVWDYFFSSLGACLGTAPTTWIVFGEINFYSIATNWFAVPPVSFFIMPLSLVQMFLVVPGTNLEFINKLAHDISSMISWASSMGCKFLYLLLTYFESYASIGSK